MKKNISKLRINKVSISNLQLGKIKGQGGNPLGEGTFDNTCAPGCVPEQSAFSNCTCDASFDFRC